MAGSAEPIFREFAVHRYCLKCGFPVNESDRVCPKCDSKLARQTDGSTTTLDIAHGKQRISEAIEQLRSAVAQYQRSPTQFLRVIVGGDRIRQAALNELQSMQTSGMIVQFGHDDRNRGALIIVLKRPE
jgi:hypothetical protein